MCSALDVPTRGHVLELGCGPGNAWAALHRALEPATLTGVDLETSVGVVADIGALPFITGMFDVVVDFGTCQEAGSGVLPEVARVLRPGGVFVHETGWAQLLAHPSRGKRDLDFSDAPELAPAGSVGLWSMRRRIS